MRNLTVILAAVAAAVLPSAAISQSYSEIWVIEYYYAEDVTPLSQVGQKIFYCDGRIEVEGQVTDNTRLEYYGC